MSFGDIIAKVKAHPELWNSSHPFYRHRVVSARTWKEIAAELRTDETAIRKRWKHLKDQYRKERKKVMSNTIPMSYWRRYNQMRFLDDTRPVNLETATGEEASDLDKKSNESDSDDAPLKAKKTKKSSSASNTSPKRPLSKTQKVPGICFTQTKSSDAGKFNLILNRLHAMEESFESKNQLNEDTKTNDSDYMFLLSLLPVMKKLKDIQKLQFRGKMNDWLLEIVTQNEYSDRLDYKTYIQNDMKNIQSPSE